MEGSRGGWLVGWLIDSSLVWAHTLLAPIIKDLLVRKKGKRRLVRGEWGWEGGGGGPHLWEKIVPSNDVLVAAQNATRPSM